MLVHFCGRRIRKIACTDIAEVTIPETGRVNSIVRLRNGERLSIPKRLPAARELAALIEKSTRQRTLKDVVDVLSAKQSVDFGLLATDVSGITYQGTRVDWNSIDRIEVEPGSRLTVFQRNPVIMEKQDGCSEDEIV